MDTDEDTFFSPEELSSSYDYFLKKNSDLLEYILENTNLYSVQTTGNCININMNDLKDFLAIELLMGMPAYTDYWPEKLRYGKIADVMPLKKYQSIRRYLHSVNNNDEDGDMYFKIRPVLEIVRRNCNSMENEKRQSIDEMMILYKGTRAGTRRQYIKNKPKKWSYKLFVRAGVSDIVYDFVIYGEADTFAKYEFSEFEETMGFGAKVVLSLSQSIPKKPTTALYFDNFFFSLNLPSYLRSEYGILSLGTLRSNRLMGFKTLPDKDLLKKWANNKTVLLASSFVSAHPVEKIKRFSKEHRAKIDVSCPQIVKQYNVHMGGVDLADMLVGLHRTAF